jgi:hypothetical protein
VAKEVWVVGNGKVRQAKSFEGYRAAQLKKLPPVVTSNSS